MQNAFINKETYKSVEEISKLLDSPEYEDIIFTRYVNDKDSLIYKSLGYDECFSEEDRALVFDSKDHRILDKATYSAYEKLKKHLTEQDQVYLCGIDVDCCVLTTAINLFENNYDVYVLKDYVYCMNGEETRKEALHILERNIGENRII